MLIDLNPDQRRESINTNQRFLAWREASARVRATRGSMVWSTTKGCDYLLRSYYDKQGKRRQSSLGPRSPETEAMKRQFDDSRGKAKARLDDLRPAMDRQAAVNRVLGLGRVPLLGARILRALDGNDLLGGGIRLLGTNAIYAYEAAAGVHVDPGLTTTEDVDLLLDARGGLSFVAEDDADQASLIKILQRVDRSFERSRQDFRAINRDGYLVDLITPMRHPPWSSEESRIGDDPADLSAVEIEGLAWHESAPTFEAVAIDERGEPLRIVATDPRVFAVHKLWLSDQPGRDPSKRRRDREQAKAVAALVTTHLQHLPFVSHRLRMLPIALVEAAAPLFTAT